MAIVISDDSFPENKNKLAATRPFPALPAFFMVLSILSFQIGKPPSGHGISSSDVF